MMLFMKQNTQIVPKSYIGETARRLVERVDEYARKDQNSYLLRHAKKQSNTNFF